MVVGLCRGQRHRKGDPARAGKLCQRIRHQLALAKDPRRSDRAERAGPVCRPTQDRPRSPGKRSPGSFSEHVSLQQNSIQVIRTRKFKRTTDRDHVFNIAPNLLQQDFTASGPNQKWAGDITYVWTREGWVYLAVILDLFSRRVVGWAVSNRMKQDLAVRALNMAVALRRPLPGCVHHTDRGSQGGFNRSSQHHRSYRLLSACRRLPQVFSSQVFCGASCSGHELQRSVVRCHAG